MNEIYPLVKLYRFLMITIAESICTLYQVGQIWGLFTPMYAYYAIHQRLVIGQSHDQTLLLWGFRPTSSTAAGFGSTINFCQEKSTPVGLVLHYHRQTTKREKAAAMDKGEGCFLSRRHKNASTSYIWGILHSPLKIAAAQSKYEQLVR